MIDERRAKLEAAIDADTDDRAYEVYADYLQEVGDPRGELISIALAASRDRAMESVAMARRIELAHVFTPVVDGWSPQVTWRNGFIHKLHLSRIAPNLLAHPSLRFVREIAMPRIANMNPLIAAIANAPSRHAIRELDIGGSATADNQDVRLDLSPLWRALPNLTKIKLRGIEVSYGVGDVPLPQLEIEASSYYGGRTLEALDWVRWPRLEWFSLAFNDAVDAKRAPAAALVAFLSGPLPALRHLAVRGGLLDGREPATFAMFDVPALFEQLDSLDLSDNLLSDDNVGVFARRISKLRSLDVSRNQLSPSAVRALAEQVPKLLAADQQSDPSNEATGRDWW